MESKGDSTSSPPPQNVESTESLSPPNQLPSVMNSNLKITPNLFVGTNYKEWAYSATMVIGVQRLGYIHGSISEPNKKDSNIHTGGQKIC